jgi:hypothetical protein
MTVPSETVRITEEAAIEWVRQTYGLSQGAAEAAIGAAINSNKVGLTAAGEILDAVNKLGIAKREDGRVRIAASDLRTGLGLLFYRDVRLNRDDLRWQIEQQLGRPNSISAPRHKGGRPPKLQQAIAPWFDDLPAEDQALSASKLAQMWKLDPSHHGQEESARKIIAKLKAGKNLV